MPLTNLDIAELLAQAGERAEGHRSKAYSRASRAALLWDVEAAEVVAAGEPASSLEALGDRLGARIEGWLQDPPEIEGPPPEKRTGFSTYAAALKELDDDPDWIHPEGDLQMHTTYSDGQASVKEMALTAANMGRSYVAITDHSQSLKIVRGMDEAKLERQGEEIARANAELEDGGLDFRVLRAIEMDLTPTGEGDMDPAALGELDLVLGSFHSQLRGTEDQTDRYLAALQNPHVNVIAHPRGRKWNMRGGLHADWPRVFSAAVERDVALEINAYPHRQDLQPELLPAAQEAGVRISIGTDAHDPTELRFLPVGLAAARSAGIPRERILNFMPRAALLEWAAG